MMATFPHSPLAEYAIKVASAMTAGSATGRGDGIVINLMHEPLGRASRSIPAGPCYAAQPSA
jgi:hypothetical protein